MSNFCINCKHFSGSASTGGYGLVEKCRHISNQYRELDPVHGTVQYIHFYAHDARREKCKGNFFEAKPIKKPWWKLWN